MLTLLNAVLLSAQCPYRKVNELTSTLFTTGSDSAAMLASLSS
ncbi:MAG TPA: hypothetical protein QF626_07835 [Prochlorococcaceae cyanobacterium Fu_MAG_50]|nr:hypothetical protein [Prochlorococcaceae cyanobacterium Fu_MAG_50]